MLFTMSMLWRDAMLFISQYCGETLCYLKGQYCGATPCYLQGQYGGEMSCSLYMGR